MSQPSESRSAGFADHDLIERCRAGDRAAQQELFEQTGDRIYRLLYRLTGNRDDAFDLTQETFVKGFMQLPNFNGRACVSTWLHRIAVNEALQQRRRSAVFRRKAEELGYAGAATYDDAVSQTTRVDVETALAQLPSDDRAILLLRYQAGLDYQAIAEVTGLPGGTVASRLHRARERLRGLLRAGYGAAEEAPVAAHPKDTERPAASGRRIAGIDDVMQR